MKRLNGYIYLFCAFTLAGSSVLPARYVAGKLGPFTIIALSQLFALIFLLPLCWKKLSRAVTVMPVKDILMIIFQALFGMFLFRMLFLNGIKLTSAGEAGILTGATPAITAILAIILLKERTGREKLSGVICTVIGIMIIQGIFSGGGSGFSIKHFWGNILILGAAASESLFNVSSRIYAVKSDKEYEFPPIAQASAVSSVTLLLSLIPAAFEHTSPFSTGIGLKEWMSLIWYGIFVTALAFICWYAGINRCGAITAAAFSGMMPFTGMLLSVMVLGEGLRWQQCLGGILIIIGMVIIGVSKTVENKPVLQVSEIKPKEGDMT